MTSRRVFPAFVLACLGPGTAFAVPIQVDYTASELTAVSCSEPGICTSLATSFVPLPEHTLTFDIDQADRAVDGSYDVSAGLAGSLLDAFQASLVSAGLSDPVTSFLTASAITQGGLVTDLLLSFAFTTLIDGLSFGIDFSASSGAYALTTSAANPDFSFAYTQNGGYLITQPPRPTQEPPDPVAVPEPATGLLLTAGLVAILLAGRRARLSRRV